MPQVPSRSTNSGRSTAALLGVLALGVLGIFFLPYLVPVSGGLSDSYIVGYSNRTALVLLLVFTLGYGLWARGLALHLPRESDSESAMPRRYAYASSLLIAVCTVVIWVWTRPFVTFQEATYFLDRYEVYRLGGHIYRDFEFPYGPLMFYPPIWISHLLHLTYGDGHFLFWTMEWIAGVLCIWQTVKMAAAHTRHRLAVFLLMALLIFPAICDGGSNYQPLRFFSSLLLALYVHRWHSESRPLWQTFSLAAIGTAALLFYSPEHGIAFALGTVLFFLICVREDRPAKFVALGLYAIAFVAEMLFAIHIGIFDSLKDFGAGALNLPLLLGPQTLVLITLLCLVGCVAVAAFRQRISDHRLLYLVAVALPLASPALSRCDPGHIFINTLGALLAVIVVLSQYPRLWKWTSLSLLAMGLVSSIGRVSTARGLFFGPLKQIAYSGDGEHPLLKKIYLKAMFLGLGHDRGVRKLQELESERARMATSHNPLPAGTWLFAPFGSPRRVEGVPGGLNVTTGYYYSYLGLLNVNGPQHKIDEIRAHAGMPLLIPALEGDACKQDVEGERRLLRLLFLAPIVPPARHQPASAQALCTYIESHYSVSEYTPPYPQFRIWTAK